MPNHKSAEKRVRQTAKRNEDNRARRTKVRGVAKKVEELIARGDLDQAAPALKSAQKALAHAASAGVVHKRTAARKTSRLAQRLKKAATKKA